MLDTSTALNIAIEALAHMRGFTYPKEIVRHGPLRIYHDASGSKGPARTEEIFGCGASANELPADVQDYAPRGRYFLEPLLGPGDDGEAMKHDLKAAGYRLARTEPLFVCELNSASQHNGPFQVRRVTMEALNQRARPMLSEHFTSQRPLARMYYVDVDGKAVAAVTSVQMRRNATWVHNLGTCTAHRRRGIATMLMQHVLAEDARSGAKHSVLLASRTGALLYPQLGYRQSGLLHIYNPLKA